MKKAPLRAVLMSYLDEYMLIYSVWIFNIK